MGLIWYSGSCFLFDRFKDLQKRLLKNRNKLDTSNWIFRLHTRWSVTMSFIFFILIFAPPFIVKDSTMICFGPDEASVPPKFVDHYCFLHGTYIVPEWINGRIDIDVPHRGIGPDRPHTTKLYQLQYLWYGFVILIQLILFRMPKNLWGSIEDGRLRLLLSELTTALVNDLTLKKRVTLVAEYMTSFNFHTKYTYQFICCEVVNVVNFGFQVWLLDYMFDGEFLGFGWNAVRYISSLTNPVASDPVIMDPFIRMFPKMTMCRIEAVSPGGNLINQEALCVLPINNMAEKVFFLMWFWFVFLGAVTILGLIYRCAVVSSKTLRYVVMRIRIGKSVCEPEKLKYLVDNFTYGDWFVFSLIEKNADVWVFSKLFDELCEKMKGTRGKDD